MLFLESNGATIPLLGLQPRVLPSLSSLSALGIILALRASYCSQHQGLEGRIEGWGARATGTKPSWTQIGICDTQWRCWRVSASKIISFTAFLHNSRAFWRKSDYNVRYAELLHGTWSHMELTSETVNCSISSSWGYKQLEWVYYFSVFVMVI